MRGQQHVGFISTDNSERVPSMYKNAFVFIAILDSDRSIGKVSVDVGVPPLLSQLKDTLGRELQVLLDETWARWFDALDGALHFLERLVPVQGDVVEDATRQRDPGRVRSPQSFGCARHDAGNEKKTNKKTKQSQTECELTVKLCPDPFVFYRANNWISFPVFEKRGLSCIWWISGRNCSVPEGNIHL